MGSSYAENLTIERIFSDPSLNGKAPKSLKYSPDGSRVTYLQGKKEDYNRFDLWEYNLKEGKNKMLVDSKDIFSGPENLSDEEKARRERQRVFGSGIMEYSWDKEGKALLFPLNGDLYHYQLATKTTKKLTDTDAFETDAKFSPKGNYVSFIREQNIFVLNVASGKELQLTTDGGNLIKNGMAEFVAQEEMGRMTGYWWSPDETKIAYTRVDETPVEAVTRSEIYADNIKMIHQRYPSAGTPNVSIQLGIKGLNDTKTTWVDIGKEKDIYIPRVKWMNDSQTLSYQWQDRAQQTLKLNAANANNGKSTTLLTEKSETWVNLHKDLRFLKDNKHFIWASERDGFKHLYLYKNNGELVTQLTKGEWVVDKLQAIDEKNNKVYFTGRADTPLERHLYSASLNGKHANNVTRISSRKGFHSITFAKDATSYIDKYSTINSPSQVSLHNANGKRITWLVENAVNTDHPLHPYLSDWIEPEFGKLTADDGQALHYRMYKPANFNANKKYPALVYLYGGPHAQVVNNSWSRYVLFSQFMAQQGYVVFSLDNRGSNYRGTKFENPIYRKMGSVEVDDQVTGAKFLQSLDFVDNDKIGVYGHSYGGYMTLMTMFKAGDYFKAGVSGAPVTDWRLYDTHYTERYMGLVPGNEDVYEAASVFPYVDGLKGPLMIYHGMADDNVLFTHSTKLYKVLQDKTLDFEMMNYPGKKHSLRGKKTRIHWHNMMINFFNRHFDVNQD